MMISQEALQRGGRIRKAGNGAVATEETRVALIVAERGLTEKQLAKYWTSRRKNGRKWFDHWRFAEDQGISPDWLFEGDLRAHPRGTGVSGATAPRPHVMTTEEFKDAYLQLPPEIQQLISSKMRDMIEKRSPPHDGDAA